MSRISRYLKRVLLTIIPHNYHLQALINNKIVFKCNSTIQSGPFKGILFNSKNVPMLLGTYEKELQHILYKIIEKPFQVIINIGAHEGYYVIGLATKLTESKIIAFESDSNRRNKILNDSIKNQAESRVQLYSYCDTLSLKNSINKDQSCCIIIDIDGGEGILLDPNTIPELENCFILVECHDFVYDGITEIIKQRFNKSHFITEINQRRRNVEEFPLEMPKMFNYLFNKNIVQSMSEYRPEKNNWMILEPLK